ncbi:MAG: GspE/PulE family protein [Candidatus Absconditabacteria bacterium]
MFGLSKTILEPVDIQGIKPDPIQVKILPRETCEQLQAIIFAKEKNNLAVLTTNNFPEQIQALIKQLEEKNYLSELYYTSPEGFGLAMKWYDDILTQEATQNTENQNQKEAAGKGAIAMMHKVFEKRDSMDPGEFIMELIRLAFQSGASDLHFQPEVAGVFVRIRVDGVLEAIVNFTHEEFVKYLQKMKFIAGTKMNVDYVPQDGRFSFDAVDKNGAHKKVDARINFMPGVENESTVIRFLDGSKGISTFEEIGFTGRNYEVLKRNIEKNVGITIITGPTGSGKTTTLYSVLHTLNDGSRKIITLEDPIEYQVAGIQQSQINYAKGYDYELGLKAILRHDPEVILVGETRTAETAETSINAALTGHAVFTTLHTNSAIESISRLLNMGVKPYMLAPALNLIVAQRLVRKVCPHCSTKRDAQYGEKTEIEEHIKKINDANPGMNVEWDGKYLQAVGCELCNGTGYIGRIGIIETLEITDDLRNMIIDQANTMMIYSKVRESGYLTMKEDGVLKMLEGLTTLDELRRVS